MADALAPLLIPAVFLWLAWSLVRRQLPGTTRGLQKMLGGFLRFSLVRPTKERGVLFGLWHFVFALALVASVSLLLFPSRDVAHLAGVLWASVILGRLLRPADGWRRREVPLPRRRRSSPRRRYERLRSFVR